MRKCEICKNYENKDNIYCDICENYSYELDDLFVKPVNSYFISPTLKIESKTIVFKDTTKSKQNIIDFIEDLYKQYPLIGSFEYAKIYYDCRKYPIEEYIIYSNTITTLNIIKYDDYFYITFDTYLLAPKLKDVVKEKSIMNNFSICLFIIICLLLLFYVYIGYRSIISNIILFLLFILVFTLVNRICDYFEVKKQRERDIKENNKIKEEWKNKLFRSDHISYDQHFIIEQLKDYVEEYIETMTKQYSPTNKMK